MRQQLYIVLLIVLAFAGSSCGRIASHAQSVNTGRAAAPIEKITPKLEGRTPQENDSASRLVSVKQNSKYGLSVTFRQLIVNGDPISHVRINCDKLGQDVDIREAYMEEVFPERARDVWSPNEEYLLLSCGTDADGFCLYKSASVLKLFGKDGFFRLDKYLDRIVVLSGPREPAYAYRFARWEGSTAFIFTIGHTQFQPAEQNYKYESVGEYKYDIARGALYCLSGYCASGENKQGKVRLSDLRQQQK